MRRDWVIRNHPGDKKIVEYLSATPNGLSWVTRSKDALRFGRKVDAENFALCQRMYETSISVVSHGFLDGQDEESIDDIVLRPALDKFSRRMEAKLRKNDHKTEWLRQPLRAHILKMGIELKEFEVALQFETVEAAISELVDIANFCLIISDKLDAHGREPSPDEVQYMSEIASESLKGVAVTG